MQIASAGIRVPGMLWGAPFSRHVALRLFHLKLVLNYHLQNEGKKSICITMHQVGAHPLFFGSFHGFH